MFVCAIFSQLKIDYAINYFSFIYVYVKESSFKCKSVSKETEFQGCC